MSLLLAAAAGGFFGDGMISERSYSAHNVRIVYDRFMRMDKDTQMYIQVKDLGQQPVIGINNDYLKKVRILQVTPEPASVAIRDNTLVYRFHPVRNGFITFFLSPQQMGSQNLEITVAGKKMRLEQFIYF